MWIEELLGDLEDGGVHLNRSRWLRALFLIGHRNNMTFSLDISINEDNAAFDGSGRERDRLLEQALGHAKALALGEKTIHQHPFDGNCKKALVDRNGNTVGSVEITTNLLRK